MSFRRPTGPFVSAAATLAAARAESSRILRVALAKCEASRAQVAAQLACSDSRLSQFVDEQADPTLDIARAALLLLPARIELAEWIAGPGYLVIAIPEATDAADLAASAAIMRTASELAARHLEACADGRVTAREGASLAEAGDAVVRLGLGVIELGRRAMREGVVGAARGFHVVPKRGAA